ncbi:hypothetical protein CFN79_05540 [Chromobacterium vaccinii]|nr:hypothetical protein CFN79_05540 [Chromobacterium vaccinii]
MANNGTHRPRAKVTLFITELFYVERQELLFRTCLEQLWVDLLRYLFRLLIYGLSRQAVSRSMPSAFCMIFAGGVECGSFCWLDCLPIWLTTLGRGDALHIISLRVIDNAANAVCLAVKFAAADKHFG